MRETEVQDRQQGSSVTGNHIQYPVINRDGKEYEKVYIRIN